MSENPFSYGKPIIDPARFYNRKNEIRNIQDRLLSSAHESTSVVGERRIGKTSLLKHLSNPQVANSYDLSEDKYCLIYIDFQGMTGITPHRFWQGIFDLMVHNICDQSILEYIEKYSQQEKLDMFDLEKLFGKIRDRGLCVALFMDEFEVITQNPNFGTDFFGGLRSLAINTSVALVTATQHNLLDLCHSKEVKSSPFFNIFSTVQLRPFNKDDSEELITGYVQRAGQTFSSEEIELVLSLGGGYPFFLQMAGFYVFDQKTARTSSTPLFERVRSEFENQAEVHFQYLWGNCSESEKITLLSVIAQSQKKPSIKAMVTIENLIKIYPQAHLDVPGLLKRGFLLEEGGCYKLFSNSLYKWIVREVIALPGQEESQTSVDTWLNDSGFEQLAESKAVFLKFKKRYWPVIGTLLKELSLDLITKSFVEILFRRIM